jgi:hypothetical protein
MDYNGRSAGGVGGKGIEVRFEMHLVTVELRKRDAALQPACLGTAAQAVEEIPGQAAVRQTRPFHRAGDFQAAR